MAPAGVAIAAEVALPDLNRGKRLDLDGVVG